jgi:hypothetical protein
MSRLVQQAALPEPAVQAHPDGRHGRVPFHITIDTFPCLQQPSSAGVYLSRVPAVDWYQATKALFRCLRLAYHSTDTC